MLFEAVPQLRNESEALGRGKANYFVTREHGHLLKVRETGPRGNVDVKGRAVPALPRRKGEAHVEALPLRWSAVTSSIVRICATGKPPLARRSYSVTAAMTTGGSAPSVTFV